MNIVLIGPPFVGKTTLGKKLAKHLNLTFVDTDTRIESLYLEKNQQKLTFREIHKKNNIEFRDYETLSLKSFLGKKRLMITCGGGIVEREENRNLLKKIGRVIYLKHSGEVLQERFYVVRPTYASTFEEYLAIVKKREPFYQEIANKSIDLSNTTYEKLIWNCHG